MKSVAQHYADHLAPVYVWMAGGLESALARGAAELASLGITRGDGLSAVDLGAGFGMHSIPLTRCGCSVLALDGSATLLSVLRDQIGSLPIHAVEADLRDFPKHLAGTPDLILCMGDTLNHLPVREAVARLVDSAAQALETGGRFIVSFRDSSTALTDEQCFIPVRSDERRIHTCFLEYFEDHVQVHDLLHERARDAWSFRSSSYRKLRLAPDWVADTLANAGFTVRQEVGLGGMLRFDATRI